MANSLVDEAVAAFRESVRIDPGVAVVHFDLGTALAAQGRPDEASAAYREAIRLEPTISEFHRKLGLALFERELVDESIACFREAIRLEPDHAAAHHNLGVSLGVKGLIDDAIAAFRAALRIRPGLVESQVNLGRACMLAGRHAESLAAFRAAHEIESQRTGGDPASAQWVAEAESRVRLGELLERHLDEGTRPSGAALLAALAEMASWAGRVATAVQWYRAAFEDEPGLAARLIKVHRRSAAHAALRAATSGGSTPAEAAEFRRQALEWLDADLSRLRAGVDRDSLDPSFVREILLDWRFHADLDPVRAPAALAALPDHERTAWTAFWTRAATLRAELEE